MKRAACIRQDETGFTLIEVLIAVALFSILSLSVYSLMDYGASAYYRLQEKSERLESARIAMDMMISELEYAHTYKITTQSGGILHELTIYKRISDTDVSAERIFSYNLTARQLNYGSNELAKKVEDIRVTVEEADMLTIALKMIPTESGESIELRGQVNVRYKKRL